MQKPPFFIVGCPRSGTSLLRSLLRSHPNLTAPSESHFIPRCYKAFGDPANASEARRISRFILETSWVKEWGALDVGPDDFADCRSYREIVRRVFEAFARLEGKPRWGDKTPQHVLELPTLLQVFPEAKIIHIIRDGRDVAHSWLRTRYHPHNYYTAAQLWRRFVEAGMRFGSSASPGVYLEVRYEALLESPRETMQSVCDFLDEPFDEAVLSPNPTSKDLRMTVGRMVSLSKLVTANQGKWRSTLSPEQRALFESVAGDFLSDLGYEVEGRSRPLPAWERSYWQMHQNVHATWVALRMLGRRPGRFKTRMQLRLMDARNRRQARWIRDRA